MSTMVVEIHVPLSPAPNLPDGACPYPWIEEIEDFLADLDDHGDAAVFDDGEEHAGAYVFLITGAGEGDPPEDLLEDLLDDLLEVASRLAMLPGVPAGVVAFISDDEAEEFGLGRRISLPLP
ncbi:hypothetical protein KK483_34500 [Streptomyces sp. FIT100]|nr:hypothetical protein KK483_34500 [Streptomyces sp. FIT100]